MAKKTAAKSSDKKVSTIISLRLNDEFLARIDKAQEKIQSSRGAGAKEVTKSEAIQILIQAGLEKLGYLED